MPAISDQDMNAMLAEESRVSYKTINKVGKKLTYFFIHFLLFSFQIIQFEIGLFIFFLQDILRLNVLHFITIISFLRTIQGINFSVCCVR